MKEKLKLQILLCSLVSLFAVACGNQEQVYDPNKGISAADGNVISGEELKNSQEDVLQNYEVLQTLNFHEGQPDTKALKDIQVAKHISAAKQLVVYAPNLDSSTTICVISGIQYQPTNMHPNGYNVVDLPEFNMNKQCGHTGNKVMEVTMPYEQYNVVYVILRSDFDQFVLWANGQIASYDYPGLAESLIDDLYPSPY